MTTSAEFLIEIEQRLRGDDAVAELDRVVDAVREGSSAYRDLDKSAAALNAKMTAVASSAASVRSATAAAAGGVSKMAAATQQSRLGAALASTKFGELAGAFGELGGPLGSTASMAFQLGDSFQKLGQSGGPVAMAAGAAALGAAAFVALGAAIAAAAVAVVAYGIKAANAARSQRLLYEATFESEAAASEMAGTFRELEKSTGASRDRLFDVSKQLKAAGIQGADASAALKAIATQEAAIGQDGTAALIDQLKQGKTSAAELAEAIDRQYGGVVAKQMMGLDQSAARLQGNFAALFSGLNIEGFLARFAAFVDTFDETSASGRVLKTLFETVFQPLVDGAAAAFPYVSLFIQKFINQALKIAIAVKPAVESVSEFFGVEPNDAMAATMKGAEVAATALAITIGSVVAVIGVLSVAAMQVGSAFLAAWNLAKSAWNGISGAVTSAIDSIKGMSLADVGAMLIDGFVNGIKSGASKVTSAVSELGKTAKDGLMSAIGAASPAKEFMAPGEYSAQGYAVGIENGAGEVEDAVSSMVSGGGALPAGRAQGGPVHVELHFHGVTERSMLERVRREVEDVFADLSISLGGSPDAEAA